MKYEVILTRTWCPPPAGTVCSPTPWCICNPKPGFKAGSSPSTSVHHRIMFPLSCREDDLGKGKKKGGSSQVNVLQNKGVLVQRQGSTRCENTAVPHVSTLQLLSTAQKGAETRSGGDTGQLCLPTEPACSSASQHSLGRQVKTRQKLSLKAPKVIFWAVFSATPRHPNLAVLQHEPAAGRTSHLHPHQLTMLQCWSLSGVKSDLGVSPFSRPPLSEPHSSMDGTAAQRSLHKAKPSHLCVPLPPHMSSSQTSHILKHISKKKQEAAIFLLPDRTSTSAAHRTKPRSCRAARPNSQKHPQIRVLKWCSISCIFSWRMGMTCCLS